MTPADHLMQARRSLDSARYLLAGDFADKAGRESYLAGFHAAHAAVMAFTGKHPKTHAGVRSEFARLALVETRISREQVSFLGWAYELKTASDYGQMVPVSVSDAERAIREAARFIEVVAALLPP